jgi:hypothetical protein
MCSILIALADAEPDWDKKVAAREKAAEMFDGIAGSEVEHAQALSDFARWLYQDDSRGRQSDHVCKVLHRVVNIMTVYVPTCAPTIEICKPLR